MARKTNSILALSASALLAVGAFAARPANAAIFISEVDAAGSNATYGTDWFEVTNTNATPLDITGWQMDDSSNAFATSYPLRGLTSIPAGKSAVFIENGTDSSTDATKYTAFETAWFGSGVPAGFLIGAYGGTQVGLSTSAGDGVNLFNASGVHQVGVSFGATPTGATLDNAAGIDGGTIATASVVGVNGAYTSATNEIGSPGAIANTPEPVSGAMVAVFGAAMLHRKRA